MPMIQVDRRGFLTLAAAGGGALVHRHLRPAPVQLRVAVVVPPPLQSSPVMRQAIDGVTLGAEEAARTMALFNTVVDVDFLEHGGTADGAAGVTRAAVDAGSAVVITVGDAAASAASAGVATGGGRLFVDVNPAPASAESRRDAPGCAPWVVRIAPSTSQKVAAVLRAVHAQPAGHAARRATGTGGTLVASSQAAAAILDIDARIASELGAAPLLAGARIIDPAAFDAGMASPLVAVAADSPNRETAARILGDVPAASLLLDLDGTLGESPEMPAGIPLYATPWLPTLERFGAAQLNDRFRARFAGAAMTGAAWCGWFALKAVGESALRARDAAPGAVRRQLLASRFDGHKGSPLSFSPDQQLMQPLYVAGANPARPFEAPAQPSTGAACSRTAFGWRGAAVGLLLAVAGALPAAAQQSSRPAAARPAIPVNSGAPASELLWISNEESRDVSVVRAGTLQLVARIPVGERPRGIQASADGRRLYVALSDEHPNRESGRDAVVAIDTRTRKIIARHRVGTDPEQFGLSPDGRRLYAANEDAGTASVTDLTTGRVLATLVVGIEPEGVAVSPDGRWVYVTAETSNSVSVLDTRTNTIVANILVDIRPRGVVFAPDGRRAYVTAEIGGTLSAIDVARHEVTGTVELEGGSGKPVGVVASRDGRRVYVANGAAHHVSVIDAGTMRVAGRIPVGRRPWGLALSPDGTRLYSANGLTNDVTVIDTRTHRVIGTVAAGTRPWGLAVTR